MRAYNSTIKLKQKTCVNCGKPCIWFSKKRCKDCARIEDSMANDVEAEEDESFSNLVAERRNKRTVGSSAELNRWFLDRRAEMVGKCLNCGGKSCKHDDKYFKHSIAHILPKAYFPSVATHPSNWIELCFWDKSCHTNMDNKIIDLTEMACWDTIVTRFQEMYPLIDKKERKRIPETLLQYVEIDL